MERKEKGEKKGELEKNQHLESVYVVLDSIT